MDKEKEQLLLYAKYINDSNSLDIKELSNIVKIVEKSRSDKEISNLLSQIQRTNNLEKNNALIEKFTKGKEAIEKEEEKELISTVYGINVSDIKHKVLKDDSEIFLFYSQKLNKNIVLENNNKGMSLVDQLKRQQQEDINSQTQDEIYNANNLIERQRNENNNELKLIPVNQISNYQSLIDNLRPEQKDQLNFLIKNSNALHIDAINIEHVFGITSLQYDSKIIEAHYDLDEKRYKIEQSAEYDYDNENKKNIEKNMTVDENNVEQVDDVIIEEEDNPELVASKIENSPELKGRIDLYRRYPELLNNLSMEEKEYYKNIIGQYEEVKMKENNNQKKLVRFKPFKNDKKAGFADALILSLITGFAGGIITSIMLMIII